MEGADTFEGLVPSEEVASTSGDGADNGAVPEVTEDFPTLTNADGFKLRCKYWKPDGEPTALAFISHGFAQHVDYYDPIGERLAQDGVYAFAHDHIGHGRSEGPRVSIDSVDQYIRDTFQHVLQIQEDYPKLPVFLVGHSMGGSIAILAAMENPELFQGMVLIAPLVVMDKNLATPVRLFLANLLYYVWPQYQVGCMVYDLVTSNKAIVEQMKEDPYHWHGGAKVQWAIPMLKSIYEIQERACDLTVPFLTQHGNKDRVVDPESSWILYRDASTPDRQIKVYDGAYHSLFLEVPEIATASVDDLASWIQKRIPEQPPKETPIRRIATV